jgi:hypothetical protein
MADYTMATVSYRHMSNRQSQSPMNEISSPARLTDMYSQTPASTTDDLAFVPWLFEVPHYDSQLSRASSHSGSGYISTPPSLIDINQTPMYSMEERPPRVSIDYMATDSCYSNDHSYSWPQHTLEFRGDLSQAPFDNCTLPWPSAGYGAPPLPPMDLHNPSARNYGSDRVRKPMLSTTRKPSHAENSTIGSVSDSEDSDYDDNCSSYSQRNQTGSKSSNTSESSAASVLRLGKWSVADPFTHPPQRIYVCPLHAKSGPTGSRCDQRFVRPEHLRRHMKTTHGTSRPHSCKVPGCEKSFSRGDNLRDHYWTHIQRGGRIGKNQKMSLAELKEILGPKEKKLVRKLKERLHKLRVKHGCKL